MKHVETLFYLEIAHFKQSNVVMKYHYKFFIDMFLVQFTLI